MYFIVATYFIMQVVHFYSTSIHRLRNSFMISAATYLLEHNIFKFVFNAVNSYLIAYFMSYILKGIALNCCISFVNIYSLLYY
jgi:hypothetical protein